MQRNKRSKNARKRSTPQGGVKPRKQPLSTVQRVQYSQPTFNGKQTVRVQHHEFIASIRNPTVNEFYMFPDSINIPGWDINPSNSVMFPWLSSVALNYEFYHFHKLAFELIPSMAATTSGRVYLAIDYDWGDNLPADARAMMANHTSAESNVWDRITLTADPHALHDERLWKYVLSNSRADPEPRTTFGGFLMVACNTPTNCTWDLRVSYDVELKAPQGQSIPEIENAETPERNIPHFVGTNGSRNAQLYLPSNVSVPVATVPNGITVNGISYSAKDCLDIGRLTRGIVDLTTRFHCAGTPQQVISACAGNNYYAAFYNDAWQLLGDIHSIPGFSSCIAPTEAASLNTVGAACVARSTIPLTEVRAVEVLRGARYLLPIIDLAELAIGVATGLTGVTQVRYGK